MHCFLRKWAHVRKSYNEINKCRALFQIALSAIRKNELTMPMPNSNIVFWWRVGFFQICIYAYICTYLWRAIFQNLIVDLGIVIARSIFGLALNAFCKRALHIFIDSQILWFKLKICYHYSLDVICYSLDLYVLR